MKELREDPPHLGERPYSALAYSFVISVMLFLLLPLTQLIESASNSSHIEIDKIVAPPPPPPPPEIQAPDVKFEEEEVEELKEETPPPSLDQLELSLNVDIGSELGGDVAMPTFDVGADLQEMVFNIADLDEQPTVLTQVRPIYPPDLKRAGIEGQALIIFTVDKNGRVRNPYVKSSTNASFEKPAIDAVRKWKFKPGTIDGKPVIFRMGVPIMFNLN